MMRRVKLSVLLTVAALLAASSSMTVFADSGWRQKENGSWGWYQEKDGGYVADAWKKSGNQYFYLDEKGDMAVNRLIEDGDDKYYVGGDGARAVNQWVSMPNDGVWDEAVAVIWYYFGPTGKAYRDGRKNLDGKTYIFDEEGRMLSGWQTYGDNEDLYYLGTENEGWAYTEWQCLEPDAGGSDAYDNEEWFYFKPGNGKAFKSARKYINGWYYAFDENGIMMDKWLTGTPGVPDYTGVASKSSAYYTKDVGNRRTGWVRAYARDDDEESGDQYWYYLDSRGVPFNEHGKDSYTKGIREDDEWIDVAVKRHSGAYDWDNPEYGVAAKVINNKTYLFDSEGRMMTGLYLLYEVKRTGGFEPMGFEKHYIQGQDTAGFAYYFNESAGSDEGRMMTGRQTVEVDGEKRYYYFKKDGSPYLNMIINGVLYDESGERVCPEDGNAYRIKEIYLPTKEMGSGIVHNKGSRMIVNAAGKVKRSGMVEIDGVRYKVKNCEIISEEPVY